MKKYLENFLKNFLEKFWKNIWKIFKKYLSLEKMMVSLVRQQR